MKVLGGNRFYFYFNLTISEKIIFYSRGRQFGYIFVSLQAGEFNAELLFKQKYAIFPYDMDKIMVKKYHNSIKKARNGFVKSNKSFSNSFAKSVKESEFWKKIALEQQILLHAKNST